MVDIASCKTLKIELFNGSRVMAWEVVSRFDGNYYNRNNSKNLTMVDIASCKTLKIELFNGSRVMAWEVVIRHDGN